MRNDKIREWRMWVSQPERKARSTSMERTFPRNMREETNELCTNANDVVRGWARQCVDSSVSGIARRVCSRCIPFKNPHIQTCKH